MASGCSREALSVTFAGLDIADISRLPLKRLNDLIGIPCRTAGQRLADAHPEKALVAQRIAEDMSARLDVLLDLGLGYLSLGAQHADAVAGRTAAAAAGHAGPLQPVRRRLRARRAFGRPASGRHRGAAAALDRLKASGNSLFVVEHELDVIRHADWIVDVGPAPASTAARFSTAVRCRASPT